MELGDLPAKLLIAGSIVLGAFWLIATNPTGDNTQPWSVISLIVGWLIRDSAGTAATNSVLKVQAAQPTTTLSVPPATATVTPGGQS